MVRYSEYYDWWVFTSRKLNFSFPWRSSAFVGELHPAPLNHEKYQTYQLLFTIFHNTHEFSHSRGSFSLEGPLHNSKKYYKEHRLTFMYHANKRYIFQHATNTLPFLPRMGTCGKPTKPADMYIIHPTMLFSLLYFRSFNISLAIITSLIFPGIIL